MTKCVHTAIVEIACLTRNTSQIKCKPVEEKLLDCHCTTLEWFQ